MLHDEAVEAFRHFLRDNGLPVTAQRLAIADIVLGAAEHLSAEAIMIELGARGAYAGTATVYRTLELLLRSGLVVERDFGEGFKRYEAAREEQHHGYLHCVRCGRIVEFSDDRLDDVANTMASVHGFSVRGRSFIVTGLCSACRAADEEAERAAEE